MTADRDSAARWARLAALFEAAIAHPSDTRVAFVASATEDCPDLRADLAEMLEADVPEGELEIERWLSARQEAGVSFVGRTLLHYRVIELIGSGGMGEVYRATDTRLGRDVALKVLPPHMAHDRGRLARFEREARTIAALNHPNIVTLYSVDESDGVHFLTMEVVEGQPLDRVIPQAGLSIDRIVEIADALADALAAAHEKGIVHRDLKPANVMLTNDGRVKVLDFGLAKETRAEPLEAAKAAERTDAGVVMGTPAYMSPEQIAGRAVDYRTDLFSLGVMLYEMATGSRPFRADSAAELMSAVLRDEPPPAVSIRRDLPVSLQGVMTNCLQKNPGERPASAREIQAALAAKVTDSLSPTPVGQGEGPSIAVLPFSTLSADPADAFFADGVTNEILNALAKIPSLRVTGQSSAYSFKGRNEDLRAVGAKLGVTNILEGTLRRAGNRLRITAQLVDVASGYQIWSERYDRVVEDVFEVQDDVATRIAERLELSLSAPRRGGEVARPTRSLEAYKLYLAGRNLLYQRGVRILDAIECFKQAVTLDPEYAQAWAGLADGYTTSGYSGFKPPAATMPEALRAARRALELDPRMAEAHNALACATMLYERDDALAEQSFRRALELNPSYPQARAWYGLFYLQWVAGREREGREELARLLRLDPLWSYAYVILAFSDFTSGRAPEGVEHARRGIEIDANSYIGHWALAQSLLWSARYEEAAAAAERALAMSGRHNWTVATLVTIYAAWRKPDEAHAVQRELEARSEHEFVLPSVRASAAAALGDIDAAVALTRRALIEKDPFFVIAARSWPALDPLRTDVRFQQILGQLKEPGLGTS